MKLPHQLSFAISVLVALLLVIWSPRTSFAEISINPSSLQLPSSVDEIISRFPAPLRDFAQNVAERFRAAQFSFGSTAGSSGIHAPQQFSLSEVLRLVKEVIVFIGGFLLVILRIAAGLIESVVRWTQSLL